MFSVGFVAVVAGILSLPWTASARAPKSEASNPLESLIRYSKLRSIHFIAHAAIWVVPHDDQVRGTGEFEFWAVADRYRVRCVTSRQLELASDLEVAFDGDRRQMFEHEHGLLTVKRGDNPTMPLALPNPLFLPLDFLSPDTDTCRLCAVRLTDLQDPRFWSRRTQTAHLVNSSTSDAKNPEYTYTLDGGVLLGGQLSYRADLGMVQGAVVPLRMTRFYSDGSRREVSASNFEVPSRRTASASPSTRPTGRSQDGDSSPPIAEREIDSRESEIGPIPSRVVMMGYDTTGKNVSNVTYMIGVIDVNCNPDASIFTIDASQAKAVWDGDAHVFTKHYDPAMVNRKIPVAVPR
jgi:hypothetical protein